MNRVLNSTVQRTADHAAPEITLDPLEIVGGTHLFHFIQRFVLTPRLLDNNSFILGSFFFYLSRRNFMIFIILMSHFLYFPLVWLNVLVFFSGEIRSSENTYFCQAARQLSCVPSSQLCVKLASGGDPTYAFNIRFTGEEVHGTSRNIIYLEMNNIKEYNTWDVIHFMYYKLSIYCIINILLRKWKFWVGKNSVQKAMY